MKFSWKTALVACLVVGIALGASADPDPIKARRAIMKANGEAIKDLTKMAKGEAPFNADVAKSALKTIHDAAGVVDFFPVGSDQGDTNALKTVWTDNAGFKATLSRLIAADNAQLASPPTNVAGVKAAIQSLSPICSDCHNKYRQPT